MNTKNSVFKEPEKLFVFTAMAQQKDQKTADASSDVEIVTFGCRLNIHESEVMRDHARNAGLSDAVIINTCAVTKEAERSARQAIRRLRRENPQKKIIVTGCSAQIDPESYAGMGEVDQVIGNDLKLQAETWANIGGMSEKLLVNDIMAVKETAGHLISGFAEHTRAFVQVQNGCDHRCTFCIIPFGRGNSRSVPIGEIVRQVGELVTGGVREVVLTGVDVTSYGPDLPGQPSLGQMIRRLLALVPELERLRLSSLDPVEIDDDLWRLIENEPRFMPHLHLSVQAGDDMTLKRMKRRHLRQDILDVCAKARRLRPDIVFGADIIAGFPTETEEMFARTLAVVEEAGLSYLHVFPYSPRPGTPAAKMPQVPVKIRKERAALLREAGARQLKILLEKHQGTECRVLLEKNNEGHSEHFLPVMLEQETETLAGGTIVPVRITRVSDGQAFGVRI